MTDYEYVTSLNRYRNSTSGQFVPRERVMGYVDQVISSGQNKTQSLSQLVTEGTISAADFGDRMREELRTSYIQQYMLGRGGREQMQSRDWGSVGHMLREQYSHLDGFVSDLQASEMSQAQVQARSNLYFQRSREAYEKGNARAHGLPRLPAYPGDMSTECKGGCHCSWVIETLPGDGNADCTWDVDPSVENCPTCTERGVEWAPLEVRDGELRPFRNIRAEAHAHA